MRFIQLQGDTDWYLLEDDGYLSNYKEGGFYPDENSPEWMNATTAHYDSWYELCQAEHYYPTHTTYKTNDVWLAPWGEFFDGYAHEVAAQAICDYMYGQNERLYAAGDYLIERGWIKLTTSLMLGIYENNGMYDNMTWEQQEAAHYWALAHGYDI